MSKLSNIIFRVSEEEKINIKINANYFDMSISSYLRFLSLLQIYLKQDEQQDLIKTSRLLLDTETYKQILFQLRQIGNNLNQAVRALNTMQHMPNVQIETVHFEDIETSIAETKVAMEQTKKQILELEKKTVLVK